MDLHKLKRTIRHQPNEKFANGELACAVPISCQLELQSPLEIVYPKAAHGQNEDSFLHTITTFAGIYLRKEKFPLHPDIVSLIWHLQQTTITDEIGQEIVEQYPFITRSNVTIGINNLNQDTEVQLVALQFSGMNSMSNDKWLITNAQNQAAIRDARYATEFSRYNTWLPWLDMSRKEFSATTPIEVYQTTVVAPLEQAQIFDPKIKKFSPHPPSLTDKMQEVYNIVEPMVVGLVERHIPLFVHLLFLGSTSYQLVSFEILLDGSIKYQSTQRLADPLEIGLPSAASLGFSSFNEVTP